MRQQKKLFQTLISFFLLFPLALFAQQSFDIFEYRVGGVSLIEPKRIEVAIYPFLGAQKTLGNIEKAADAIERLYRDEGYPAIYVDIPEQDVVGGIVRLNVVEGKVSRVKVSDANFFALTEIRKNVPSLQEQGVLHLPSLQKDLNQLNSLTSDLSVVPILKPGKAPGTMDVELKVRDKLPLHGDVELNNYHSKNTTDTRLAASIGYDNFWQKQHSMALRAQLSPEDTDEVNVISINYIMPWRNTATRMAFYAVDSQSDIATFGDDSELLIVGDSSIYGFRYVKPLQSTRRYLHSLSLGFDYKDVEELVQFTDNPGQEGIVTPLTYLVWSAQYNATKRSESVTTRYGLGVNFGVRGLANSIAEFENKRFKGEPDFFYLQASYKKQYDFGKDWSFILNSKAQLTASPLVGNEQLSAGGASSVRGYFEGQQGADMGLILGFELKSPNMLKEEGKLPNRLKALFFIEGASLQIVEPLPDQIDRFDLAAVGLGLRGRFYQKLKFKLDWGVALKESCTTNDCSAEEDIDKGDGRFMVSIKYDF